MQNLSWGKSYMLHCPVFPTRFPAVMQLFLLLQITTAPSQTSTCSKHLNMKAPLCQIVFVSMADFYSLQERLSSWTRGNFCENWPQYFPPILDNRTTPPGGSGHVGAETWTAQPEIILQSVLSDVDWDILRTLAADINELAATVSSITMLVLSQICQGGDTITD